MSRYEDQLARQIELRALPAPERQFRFALPHRQYRVDFAWPDRGLAVEVDGGAFVGRGGQGSVISRLSAVGYHQTVEDYRKRNLLNLLGWRLLAYQPQQIARGEALTEIELALAAPFVCYGVVARTPWADNLWAHVDRLGEVDKLQRRVREAKTKQRKFVRDINAEAKKIFPRGLVPGRPSGL
jgi:very-short-patch-repair endonuclease